jgi:hypothetical protein
MQDYGLKTLSLLRFDTTDDGGLLQDTNTISITYDVRDWKANRGYEKPSGNSRRGNFHLLDFSEHLVALLYCIP